MQIIKVVNVKCGGCARKIIGELEKLGAENTSVDIEKQEISFEGDKEKISQKLASLGYPEVGSKAAESFLKKARSFVSCAIGKVK